MSNALKSLMEISAILFLSVAALCQESFQSNLREATASDEYSGTRVTRTEDLLDLPLRTEAMIFGRRYFVADCNDPMFMETERSTPVDSASRDAELFAPYVTLLGGGFSVNDGRNRIKPVVGATLALKRSGDFGLTLGMTLWSWYPAFDASLRWRLNLGVQWRAYAQLGLTVGSFDYSLRFWGNMAVGLQMPIAGASGLCLEGGSMRSLLSSRSIFKLNVGVVLAI
jgi:hypothetical protein